MSSKSHTHEAKAAPFLRTEHVNIEDLLERFAEVNYYVLTLLNPDASIAYEPPSITRLTGFEVEDYLGKSALDFIHPDDRPKIVGLLDRLYRDPHSWSKESVVYRWQHKQGHWLTVNSSGVLLKHKGQIEGMLLISHDMTTEQDEIHALRARVKELEVEVERLQKAAPHPTLTPAPRVNTPLALPTLPRTSRIRHRTNMIKLFDHELRTPLHTIQGYVELLMEEHTDKQGIEQELMRVHQSSQELHGLIEHLVELARYEEDDMDIQLERVALATFCDELAHRVKHPIELCKDAAFTTHEIYTDRSKLLLTMVEQARFIIRQGMSLKLVVDIARDGRVNMCWRIPSEAISEATRSHLVQVLKQSFELDSTTWGRHYLALHLGRQRIVALGGRMTLKRMEGGILCWENSLSPRRYGVEATSSRDDVPAMEMRQGMPNLLFVGADVMHEAMLKAWAMNLNLSFHATHVREEILKMFAAEPEELCVCMLDVLDPNFDGWKMLAELQKHRHQDYIKIVVYSVIEDIDLAKELGADDCINKLQSIAQTGERLMQFLSPKDA